MWLSSVLTGHHFHLKCLQTLTYIPCVLQVPLCKFTLVVLVPKYGIQQLCWTREFRVASLAEKCFHQKLQAVGAKKTDFQVKKWFSEDAPTKLCFSAGMSSVLSLFYLHFYVSFYQVKLKWKSCKIGLLLLLAINIGVSQQCDHCE